MFHLPAFLDAFPALLSGLRVTIELTLLVMPCAVVVALLLALGMSWWQAVRRIVLPQAAIRMMPPLNTRIVRNIKDSVLASTIAVQELFWAANLLEGETAKPFPIYTTLMVFYFVVIVMIARVLDRMYVKVAARGAA